MMSKGRNKQMNEQTKQICVVAVISAHLSPQFMKCIDSLLQSSSVMDKTRLK